MANSFLHASLNFCTYSYNIASRHGGVDLGLSFIASTELQTAVAHHSARQQSSLMNYQYEVAFWLYVLIPIKSLMNSTFIVLSFFSCFNIAAYKYLSPLVCRVPARIMWLYTGAVLEEEEASSWERNSNGNVRTSEQLDVLSVVNRQL